ncbi:MAG: glycosyltransferase family 61 protein [Alphaproteobacteria bacterium]|nr:MAG: glycosyltransferase family 61 protein [Alphaproteobacteria bacterium]
MPVFDFLTRPKPRQTELADASLFPLKRERRDRLFRGGLWHTELGEDFHHWRNRKHGRPASDTDWLAAQAAPTERLAGHGLYGGLYLRHYGHFLQESIHRLWAWHEAPDRYDYLAVVPEPKGRMAPPATVDALAPFQRDVLTYLGIPTDRLRLVDRPLLADRITVPTQGRLIGDKDRMARDYAAFWAEREAAFFDRHAGDLPPTHDRIYVSRAAYLGSGGIAGERYIEKLLADEGFHIMRPEALPLIDQLHLYRNAGLILFPEGSALHTTELLGPMKADILCLMRRPHARRDWSNRISARKLEFFDSLSTRATLTRRPDGNVRGSKALCLYDIGAFVQALRAAGMAKLSGFDMDAFRRAEAADVARYMLTSKIVGNAAEPLRLDAFREALAKSGNPYLAEQPF